MGQLTRRMPDWLWAAWQHRPVVSTADRIARRIDRAEVNAYRQGQRDAVVAALLERIERGPTRPVEFDEVDDGARLDVVA